MTLPYFAYVIDDDRAMRQSLTHLLTRAGFRVCPFSDATIALDFAQRCLFRKV